MKLLVLTQKVDVEDGVLGFFHGWLEKMAKSFEKINVVCLQKGRNILPGNIQVFSLGKESGESKIKYLFRFFRHIWQLRKEYDAVFVHMNAIYVVLGGLFWLLSRKKVVLWYNHRHGNLISRSAYYLAARVLYTSSFSFFVGRGKTQQMPAGVDTDLFKNDTAVQKIDNSILYLGRIAPIKNTDILIEAAKLLKQEGLGFVLNIVGNAATKDCVYFEKIKSAAKDLEMVGCLKFVNEVANRQAPKIYNQNEIFVNLTNSGSLDKTILEAMACETLTIVSNRSFIDVLPDQFVFEENNAQDLKTKLGVVLNLTSEKKHEIGKKFRDYVVNNHSLDLLVKQLQTIFENN